jgi:hypothetical protein
MNNDFRMTTPSVTAQCPLPKSSGTETSRHDVNLHYDSQHILVVVIECAQDTCSIRSEPLSIQERPYTEASPLTNLSVGRFFSDRC